MEQSTKVDDLQVLSGKEWLESNGLGAYAAGTLGDVHTRRYHGLLITPIEEQVGRFALLSDIEAMVHIGDEEYNLGTNFYRDAIHPQGYSYLVEADYVPCPRFIYDLDGVQLSREIIMLPGEAAVYLRYSIIGDGPELRLQLKPLLTYRDVHSLSTENMSINPKAKRLDHGLRMSPYEGMPPLYVQYNQPLDYYAGPCWEQHVVYPREEERGFDDHEDRFYPGIFEGMLLKGSPLLLRVGLDNGGHINDHDVTTELERREALCIANKSEAEQRLRLHARQFFVTENDAPSIVAGYPWFGAWGRDTMIALPGLCQHNNALEHGQVLLRHAAQYLKNGLLPNTFGGIQGKEAYNSIDASLWFTWAIQECTSNLKKTDPFIKEMYPILKEIVQAYAMNETGLSECDERGLIRSGDATTQLTWMDARAWGKPVTPRYGYAVEINALWYNALCLYLQWSKSLRRKALDGIKEIVEEFPQHFQKCFWMDDLGYCADVHNRFERDPSMRPNQLFAVSLPNSPLTEVQQRHVVVAVEKELLTPFGLRTLSPKHPQYCAQYIGGPDERDASYHQGTVWPWLVGAFVAARLKVSADPKHRARDLNRKLHRLFNDSVEEYGLGGIAEIYDAEEPHAPRGCFTQAWSVAEVIRAKCIIEQVEAG